MYVTGESAHAFAQFFFLDLLDNMPRNRLSEALMKFIIWMLKELGVRDVPSYYAFRKAQQAMRAGYGLATHEFTSVFGNRFHQNDIAEIIAMVC